MPAGPNTGTVRPSADFLELYADYKPPKSSNRQLMRDFIQSVNVMRSVAINVKDAPFFAKGDGKTVTDAAITTGTNVLSSLTAVFTAADLGKVVFVQGAGAAGAPLITSILGFADAQTVLLAANAGTTVAAKRLSYGSLDTAAINAAYASVAAPRLVFPDGIYIVDDEFNPPDNSLTTLGPNVTIVQITPTKGVFAVTSRTNAWIHFNFGTIHGPGVYSTSWTGTSGHEERGLKFYGCTKSGALFPRIRNFGCMGLVVLGGTDVTVCHPLVEGTHALGTVLAQGNNFQVGINVENSAVYGAYDRIKIPDAEVFNTNQGIFAQNVTAPTLSGVAGTGTLKMPNAYCHHIIGQHGAYLAGSHITAANFVAHDCGLDGFKIQADFADSVIEGTEVTNFNIWNCPNSQAAEVSSLLGGPISSCTVNGVSKGCARTLGVSGNVYGCSFKVAGEINSQYTLYVANDASNIAGPSDNDFEVKSRSTQQHGALISSTLSANNRLKFKGFRSGLNGSLPTSPMINVTACVSLTVESPECIDDGATMQYGIFISTNGNCKITGTPVIKGYLTNAIRCIATVASEWHASGGDLGPLTTAFAATGDFIMPITPLRIGRQSISAGNVGAWTLTMKDNSSLKVTFELNGLRSDKAEEGTFTATAFFKRAGGGVATLVASVEQANLKTASFLGAYSFTPTGNQARLLVNSGAAATTVDWTVRVVSIEQL